MNTLIKDDLLANCITPVLSRFEAKLKSYKAKINAKNTTDIDQMKIFIVESFEEGFSAHDRDSVAMKDLLAFYIAQDRVSNLGVSFSDHVTAAKKPTLTTEQAAEFLDCSRPYVIMLCDEGKFNGVTKTVGGHRRIPLDSLVEWKNEHSQDGPPAYKEAASEAGLYDIPDELIRRKFVR